MNLKSKNIIIFLTFLTVFLFFKRGSAIEYYVDYKSGNDSNNGMTSSLPWKHCPGDTLATGNAESTGLQGGDVVYFKRGITYDTDKIIVKWSGEKKVESNNCSIENDGFTLTCPSLNFISAGVENSNQIYINGEGIFSIDDIEISKINLSTATKQKSIESVEILIANFIKYSIKDNWGTGSAVIKSGFYAGSNSSQFIIWDGTNNRSMKITETGMTAFYINKSGIYDGFIIRNIDIYKSSNNNSAGIYMRNIRYALIENCEISYNGNNDSITGDDGISLVTRADYVTIQNNDIHHNGDDGIQCAPCDKGYIQYNNIHNSGDYSGNVHPDGIATNATTNFDLIIRYNKIYDNRNHTDIEAINMEFYGNLIYDRTPGPPGNHGLRIKMQVNGTIINNIFAWCNAGVYAYQDTGDLKIMNNIFYENADIHDQPEIVLNNAVNSSVEIKNNIYVRKTLYPRDEVIGWGGDTYSVDAFQGKNFGPYKDNGTGGVQCTPKGCDWISPQVFISEDRSIPDFQPYSIESPQVNRGIDAGLQFDINGITKQGDNWDIGAYEMISRLKPPKNLRIE